MQPVNYSKMNDEELKQYFLSHKDNKEAFHAYLDRKYNQHEQVLIGVDELDNLTSDQQIQLVSQRLQEKFN